MTYEIDLNKLNKEDLKKLKERLNIDLKDVNHMINVTFKFLEDSKLLLTIIDKLYDCSMQLIELIILDNYLRKNLSFVPKTDESKIVLFETKLKSFYDLSVELLNSVKRLYELKQVKDRSVVLSKGQKIVFYIDNYSTKVYSLNDAKNDYEIIKKILASLEI